MPFHPCQRFKGFFIAVLPWQCIVIIWDAQLFGTCRTSHRVWGLWYCTAVVGSGLRGFGVLCVVRHGCFLDMSMACSAEQSLIPILYGATRVCGRTIRPVYIIRVGGAYDIKVRLTPLFSSLRHSVRPRSSTGDATTGVHFVQTAGLGLVVEL